MTSHIHTAKHTGPSLATQWHIRFPCVQERLVRMAQHLRTDEAKVAVASLRLRDALDEWVERGPERRRVARRKVPTKAVGG